MKKVDKQKDRGVTLTTLVITIVVILILSSVAAYSGISGIKSSEFTKFTSELKIMQTQVNNLYEKYKNNETIKGKEVLQYGQDITNNTSIQNQANKVFTSSASGIEDQTGYKYYSKETIKELGIEGVDQEFFVNIQKRSIISYLGIEYKEKTYYTLEQLPNGLYNVEYKETGDKPIFDINVDMTSENKYQVTIQNIQYTGYNDKWKVTYQISGSEDWKTSDKLDFTLDEPGEYNITIINGEIESDPVTKYIGYIKDGLILHYDGIANTRKGQNIDATSWEDLSGNKNDGKLNGCTWLENALKLNGTSDYVTLGELNYPNITLEIVGSSDDVNNNSNETEYICNYETGGYGLSYSTKNFFSVYTNSYYRVYGSDVVANKIYSLSGNYSPNSGLVLYENGQKYSNAQNLGAISYPTNNTELCLGANPSGSKGVSMWLNGKIYSVRVYDKVLTEEEIENNYKIDKNRFNIE